MNLSSVFATTPTKNPSLSQTEVQLLYTIHSSPVMVEFYCGSSRLLESFVEKVKDVHIVWGFFLFCKAPVACQLML